MNPATVSIVINGIYYSDICTVCRSLLAPVQVSTGHARWARGIDLEDHEADVQQPYNADGSINTGFIRLYPRQAKAIFTDEQIAQAERHA